LEQFPIILGVLVQQLRFSSNNECSVMWNCHSVCLKLAWMLFPRLAQTDI